MTTDTLAGPRTSRPGLMEVAAGAVVYLFFYYAVAPAVARTLSADAAVQGLALAALSGLMGLAAFAAAYTIRIRRFPTFGLRRVTRRQVLTGIAFGVAAMIISRVVLVVLALLGVRLDDVQTAYQEASTGGALTFVLQLIFIAVLTPIGEELAFRGVLTNALERFGPWISVPVSTLAFAAVHGLNIAFIPAIVVGGLAGYLFHRTRSVWPGVLVHAVNNGVSALIAFILAALT